MYYEVFMLKEAEHDLEAIFRYILGSGNPGASKDMIRLIRQACDAFARCPSAAIYHLSSPEPAITSTGKLSSNPTVSSTK